MLRKPYMKWLKFMTNIQIHKPILVDDSKDGPFIEANLDDQFSDTLFKLGRGIPSYNALYYYRCKEGRHIGILLHVDPTEYMDSLPFYDGDW